VNAYDRLLETHLQSRARYFQRMGDRQRQQDRRSEFLGAWQRYDAATGLHLVVLPDGSEVWCEALNTAGFESGQLVSVSRYKGQRRSILRGSPTA